MTPTGRSLTLLRGDGWLADVVERWNAHAGIRQDLFQVFDILALRPGRPGATLAVQTTTLTNLPARRAKLLRSEAVHAALTAGWLVEVHGWSLVDGRWTCRREPLTIDDLAGVAVVPVPRRRPRRARKGERQTDLFVTG